MLFHEIAKIWELITAGTGELLKNKPEVKLDGKTWLKYSISIWDDLKKSEEERKLRHPAMFPVSLVDRLLSCYTLKFDDPIVLDPFLGSGTTLVAAKRRGLRGIGFEVAEHFVKVAHERLGRRELFDEEYRLELVTPDTRELPVKFSQERVLYIVNDDARNILKYLEPESVNIAITSPPYWNVHRRKRSADRKKERPYSELSADLGNLSDYGAFLEQLKDVYRGVYEALTPGGFALINVMDIRCGSEFIPFHCDTISLCREVGFKVKDIIIWDRRQDYNNLRPLGYPYSFIINKVHEYILVFQKV